ncbi:MAG: tetratricopeptide repeat protein [SAR324 cluster bacterium]|nr:tetratricopeptide repeat protein [SAR324 cluster bacterium]
MKKTKKQRKEFVQKKCRPDQEPHFRQLFQKDLEAGNVKQAYQNLEFIRLCNPKADLRQEKREVLILDGTQKMEHLLYADAIDIFKKLKQEYPEFQEVSYWLADCYVLKNNLKEALLILEPVFADRKLPPQQNFNVLKIMLLQERHEAVRKLILEEPELLTEDDLAWTQGVIALKAQNYAEAVSCFQRMESLATSEAQKQKALAWIVYSRLEQTPREEPQQLALLKKGTVRSWLFLHLSHQRNEPADPVETKDILRDVVYSGLEIKELEKYYQKHGPHQTAHLIEDQPTSRYANVSGFNEFKKVLYRMAATEATHQKDFECAEELWNTALELAPEDWNLHRNVISLTTPLRYKSYPKWVNQTLQVLAQDAKQQPVAWPQDQLEFTRSEIAGYLGLYYLLTDSVSKARKELKKAEAHAGDALHVIALKAKFALYDKDYPEAERLMAPNVENKEAGHMFYEDLKEVYEKTNQLDKLLKLRQKFGAVMGDILQTPFQIQTKLYFGLSTSNWDYIELQLDDLTEEQNFLLEAARLLNDSMDYDENDENQTSLTVDTLRKFISGLSDEKQQIECLKYFTIGLKLLKQTPQNKKLVKFVWDQLKVQAKQQFQAKLAIVQIHGVNREKKLLEQVQELLSQSDDQTQTLIDLQSFWLIFERDFVLDEFLRDAIKKDPENPGLLWACSTAIEQFESTTTYRERALALARRLQDQKTIELIQREEDLSKLEDDYRDFEEYFDDDDYYDDDDDDDEDDDYDDDEDDDDMPFDEELSAKNISKLLNSLFGGDIPSLKDLILEAERNPKVIHDKIFMTRFMASILINPEDALSTVRKMKAPRSLVQMIEGVIANK